MKSDIGRSCSLSDLSRPNTQRDLSRCHLRSLSRGCDFSPACDLFLPPAISLPVLLSSTCDFSPTCAALKLSSLLNIGSSFTRISGVITKSRYRDEERYTPTNAMDLICDSKREIDSSNDDKNTSYR
ncbi:hypothetical protein H6P81_001615 [Aristolochia fimbriata]|uniref:Uncharacterized protein n=1 Tax=Aristolochia fimbriata TaxID=158543 RepID=A0AAV7FAN3_ARIFI|nr:hypothetical protein H6P81_001615 [Aristolochia fimbriata]